jgi:hypothetical protein
LITAIVILVTFVMSLRNKEWSREHAPRDGRGEPTPDLTSWRGRPWQVAIGVLGIVGW